MYTVSVVSFLIFYSIGTSPLVESFGKWYPQAPRFVPMLNLFNEPPPAQKCFTGQEIISIRDTPCRTLGSCEHNEIYLSVKACSIFTSYVTPSTIITCAKCACIDSSGPDCRCKYGYTGPNCDYHLNVCREEPLQKCPPDIWSQCVPTGPGTRECKCLSHFSRDHEGKCRANRVNWKPHLKKGVSWLVN